MTQQPTEGRSRDGGHRGEMERDCLLAHGVSSFLKETLLRGLIIIRYMSVQKCEDIASVNKEKGIYHCRYCGNLNRYKEVRMPYVMKLFKQEMEAMSVKTRIKTN